MTDFEYELFQHALGEWIAVEYDKPKSTAGDS